MPARIIHGEAMWSSEKIASCATEMPATSGVYYPWIYPLADANGVLELTSLRVLHAQIGLQLPFLTLSHFTRIIKDFHDNGLLFTWKEKDKLFGFWTNSDQPGRLPKPSDRNKYRNLEAHIPQKELGKYLSASYSRVGGDEMVSRSRVTGEVGANGLDRIGLDRNRYGGGAVAPSGGDERAAKKEGDEDGEFDVNAPGPKEFFATARKVAGVSERHKK